MWVTRDIAFAVDGLDAELSKGQLCRGAVAALAVIGCAAAGVACTCVTVITEVVQLVKTTNPEI